MIYIDFVQYRDGTREEMRGYGSVEHTLGWVIWRWGDSAVAVPTNQIAYISTSKEWPEDAP